VSASRRTDGVPWGMAPRRRQDALRNRTRVLDAAAATLRERGDEATVAEVARRAQVGVGTVYRHFASREALMRAAASVAATDLAAKLAQHADALAPGSFSRAIVEVALGLARSAAGRRLLGDDVAPLGPVGPPLQALLHAAQRAGHVREELDQRDLWPLVAMAACLDERVEHAAVERCLWLLCSPPNPTYAPTIQEAGSCR